MYSPETKVDPIGSVRWDKVQLPAWDDNSVMSYPDAKTINFFACEQFIRRFWDDVKFWDAIGMHDNIAIYAKYRMKRKYNPYSVVRSMMRIANTYRKKTRDDTITSLNEIIYIAQKLETKMYFEYILPMAEKLDDERGYYDD
jgi:hypothetical protein